MLSISALLCHVQVSKPYGYYLIFIFILSLTDQGSGQFQVIGPEQPIQTFIGEDALFSCHVYPKMNVKDMEVRFFRNQFSSVLFLYKDGKEIEDRQMQEYQGRTQFVHDDITEGRVLLKLKNLTLSDAGTYGCWFTSSTFYQKHTWELQVAAVGSSPLISLERYGKGNILLSCQSAGWFPRPEVQWKNHQGQTLSSDFKVKTGDNGLFEIESSITIQEPSIVDISCSIQIQGLLQEEYRVRIADQFFQDSPWYHVFKVMKSIFLILAAFAILLFYIRDKLQKKLKWRIRMREEAFENVTKYAVEVTLDQETAHPKLLISADGKEVTHEGLMAGDVPATEKRFHSPSVVALQGFSVEECYWEVDVGEKNRWYLGVCWDGVDRKKKDPELSPDNGYWVLGRWNQNEHFTFSPGRQTLTLQVQPKIVGIFLSCKYGQISFFNVTNKSHIYTFTGCDFNGKILRPYFRPRSNDDNELKFPLTICTKLPVKGRNDTFPLLNDDRGIATKT